MPVMMTILAIRHPLGNRTTVRRRRHSIVSSQGPHRRNRYSLRTGWDGRNVGEQPCDVSEFDKPFPNHTFTGFIAGENRAKFGTPEKDLLGKDLCLTGKIQDYRGKPKIVLTDPEQITPQSK